MHSQFYMLFIKLLLILLSVIDVLDVFFMLYLQNPYKTFILECLASYKVEKMPYAILPKVTPSGAKKVSLILYSSNLIHVHH